MAKPPVERPPAVQIPSEVDMWLARALEEGQVEAALSGLSVLQVQAPSPIREEAAFRRVQILLHFDLAGALDEAEAVLARYPQHALVPYAHVWLAAWWAAKEDAASEVLQHSAMALDHARADADVIRKAVAEGALAVHLANDDEALPWLLKAARFDVVQRRSWLRQAAARSSMDTLATIRRQGLLAPEIAPDFYELVARIHLLGGDMDAVRILAGYLAADAPGSKASRVVSAWARGETKPATIGVLLPLSGEYAAFGQQALRGVRLALAALAQDGNVTLRIEDSGGDRQACLAGLQRLKQDAADIVIGPLTTDCARAVAMAAGSLPVISLGGRPDLARASPMMFVHTLSLTVQAHFMAAYAMQRGDARMVVVHAPEAASREEAQDFAQAYRNLGGEVVEFMQLPDTGIDYRDALRDLRLRTDDEAVLAELDEELALSVEPDLEIRMPVNFDGLYMALPGKQVALLAGQLAYVDIFDVHLYGSGRWRDGHLLDDRGRYLEQSRFTDVAFDSSQGQDVRRLRLRYREVWGEENPSKLLGLAYDTTLIAVLLTSRLGLHGAEIAQGLSDPGGFPGITGHVRFDDQGVGDKSFSVFTIYRGRVVPAG